MKEKVALSVGEGYHLRSGKDYIVYAGMPAKEIYSLVQRKRKIAPYAVWGFAWNLFYSVKQREIRIDGVNIIVENVGPERIELWLN